MLIANKEIKQHVAKDHKLFPTDSCWVQIRRGFLGFFCLILKLRAQNFSLFLKISLTALFHFKFQLSICFFSHFVDLLHWYFLTFDFPFLFCSVTSDFQI